MFSAVIQSLQEAPLEILDWRNIACLWIWNHKHLLYIMFPIPKLHFFCKPFNHSSANKQSRSFISQTWSVYGYQPQVKRSKNRYLSSIKHGTTLHCCIVCLQCSTTVYYSYASARCIILTDIQSCFLASTVQLHFELLLSNANKHEITAAMFNWNICL